MKRLLIITLYIILIQPASAKKYGKLISQGKIKNSVYYIYSQRDCFNDFAKVINSNDTLDFINWEKIVFEQTKDLYDISLDQRNDSSKKKRYNTYKRHVKICDNKELLRISKDFEDQIEDILVKTLQFYSDEKDTISVIIMPIAGQGGTVKEISNRNSIMPLGVNLIKNTERLISIIPHEYTHRYNQLKNGLPSDDATWINSAKMFWSLWSEGLASYGTGIVTKNYSLDNLMLPKEYKSFKDREDLPEINRWLASAFLQQYDDKLINRKNDLPRAKWFASNRHIKDGLPPAIGYYLGYLVVKKCIEEYNYSFYELLMSSPNKLDKLGKKALKDIAKERI